MIRLEAASGPRNAALAENWSGCMPADFFSGCEFAVNQIIRRNMNPAGAMSWYPEDKNAVLRIWFAPDTDDRRKLLAVVSEHIVRRLHPDKILIENPDPDLEAVYESNSYRKNGEYYEKTIEPWRRILSDRVFDEEGYIINQGMMKDIPFGWFDTKAKGCGWIAAWNLLKMNGMEVSMETCAHELEKHAVLGEMMGLNLFRLYPWLKKQGLSAGMSLPINSASMKKIRESSSGIILYTHIRGGHYTTYRYLGNQKVQLYNAVYGKRNHVIRIDEFMKKFTLFPTSVVIYVKNHQ